MTVAPELDALVRACFANPKANLPRLVLADYLDEQGEADRATVLRIQCELAPPKKKGDKPKIKRGTGKDLREAVARLKERIAPLRAVLGPLKFVRGFLALSVYGWYALARHPQVAQLRKLFADGWVESVKFTTLYGGADDDTFALLRQAGTLEIARGQLPAGVLADLAAKCRPGLANCRLNKLTLPTVCRPQFEQLLGTAKAKPPANPIQDYRELTPDTARMVADSGALDGVRALTLGGNPGADGFRRIVSHPAVRRVATVLLNRLNVPPAALAPLWAVETTALTHLTVLGTALGDAGLRQLCGGSFLPGESLRLHGVELTAASAVTLNGCRGLNGLRFLDLGGNDFDAAAIAAVVRSATFANVRQFQFGGTGGLAALPALFAAPHRPDLSAGVDGNVTLRLRRTRGSIDLSVASYAGATAPTAWPDLPPCPEPLHRLTFGGVRFTAADARRVGVWLNGNPMPVLELFNTVRRVADWSAWLALIETARPRELELRSMDLGPRGFQRLAASPALATVRKLTVLYTRLGLTGLRALDASPNRGSLKELHFVGCGLSRAERTQAAKLFDGVKVSFT